MNKAVFLDRDGVINKETGNYIFKTSDFIINDGIPEALKLLYDKGFLLIIISNQGGIARKKYTKQDVDNIHKYLTNMLSANNIEIAGFYYCPHHTKAQSYCLCRKPDSLMLEKAIARFNIDINKSYFIGDNIRDMEAGKKAGLNTIKINANDNILELCKKIINNAY